MKKILFILVLIIINSCAIKKNNQNRQKKFSILINTKKGLLNSKEHMNIYITFVNNSDEDIVILKPETEWRYALDFFKVLINCEHPNEDFGVEFEDQPNVVRTENDLVTIKSKSSKEFKILGEFYHVICDSEDIIVKVQYNSEKIPTWVGFTFFGEDDLKTKKLYEKLTKLNVESKETRIKLK